MKVRLEENEVIYEERATKNNQVERLWIEVVARQENKEIDSCSDYQCNGRQGETPDTTLEEAKDTMSMEDTISVLRRIGTKRRERIPEERETETISKREGKYKPNISMGFSGRQNRRRIRAFRR